ncbi:MAG: PPC domain-containing DNA-binding protein [Synechococcus sp.]
MSHLPVRLQPGVDLRRSLEQKGYALPTRSGFVVAGIGSLACVSIRLAGEDQETRRSGSFELVSLSGTLSARGAHLHMTIANETGQVIGGHLGYGTVVRTTAEVLLVSLPDWHLTRAHDPATGYQELLIRPGHRDQAARQKCQTSDPAGGNHP